MAKKMTPQFLWENVIASVVEKKIFQETSINHWLKPLAATKYMDGVLILETANNFAPQVLNTRYRKKLSEIAKEIDGNFLNMKFVVAGEEQEQNAKEISLVQNIENATKKQVKKMFFSHPINPQYTFAEFVETSENQLAAASALGIANNPGATQRYNPFFIYGRAGVGKTHILQAMANEIVKNKPQLKTLLLSGDEFYRSFSAHISKNIYEDFENVFRQADVILFDNIHELSGKKEAQLELYKIFNKSHQQKKQMVFTANCSPEQLSGFQERIITRLQWGLTVKLDTQNQETRAAILANMAQKSKIKLSADEINYIVDNCSENIHELQGIVANIAVSASINKTPITSEAVRDALKNRNLEPIKGYYAPKTILEAVCSYYKIDLHDVKSKSRVAHIVWGRQVAIYFLKKYTPLPLQAIGAELGGKNHSTILHSFKEVENDINEDERISKEIKEISNILARS